MNLKIGIVGLPNVGKSTLFNALTKSQKAEAKNFPFCTIDPNIGIVNVPDERLQKIAKITSPQKIIPSTIEFVDIAGLVAGASKGEGLGNKFLSHIRECHAIAHVIRDFNDSNVHHVNAKIDPKNDFEIILTELILADLESVASQKEKLAKKIKTGSKEEKNDFLLLEKIHDFLSQEKLVCKMLSDLTEEEQNLVKKFNLLTSKKFMIIANLDEDSFINFDIDNFKKNFSNTDILSNAPVIPICAKTEAELCDLSDAEAKEFLAEIGAKRSGLENLIQKSFDLLGLENFFTAGEKEVRSWTIYKNTLAPKAAAEIHTDFEKGFIAADVIAYDDFIKYEGENGAKENGKLRNEGKNYVVKNGDIIHFKFNV